MYLVIRELDSFSHEPRLLPKLSGMVYRVRKLFCPRGERERDATGFRQNSYCRILFLSTEVSTTLEAGSFPSACNIEELQYTRVGGFIRTKQSPHRSGIRVTGYPISRFSFFFFFYPKILFAEDARGRDGRETTMRRMAPYNIISRPSNSELYRLTSSLRASGYPERRSRRF